MYFIKILTLGTGSGDVYTLLEEWELVIQKRGKELYEKRGKIGMKNKPEGRISIKNGVRNGMKNGVGLV